MDGGCVENKGSNWVRFVILFGFVLGMARLGAPGSVCGFQRSRGERTHCGTSSRMCIARRSTRCERSTAATGTRLTDCLWPFVFSVDGGMRDASPWPTEGELRSPGDPRRPGGCPFLIGANLSNAQCRGVSFALEAADLPDAYPRPISAASHIKDARDTDKCPRWQCLVINRRCRKTHF